MSDPQDEKPKDPYATAPIEVVPTPPKNRGGRPRKRVLVAPQDRSDPLIVELPKPVVEEPVDESGLLTASEIEVLRAEARDAAMAERKKAVRQKIKDRFFKEERAKLDPTQEMVSVRLELAEYAEGLVIDGVKYFHNGLYTVPRAKYDVFAEQMYRSAEHQNQIDGKSRRELQRRLYREKLPGGELSMKQVA